MKVHEKTTYATRVNFKTAKMIHPEPSDEEKDDSDDDGHVVNVKDDPQFTLAVTRGLYLAEPERSINRQLSVVINVFKNICSFTWNLMTIIVSLLYAMKHYHYWFASLLQIHEQVTNIISISIDHIN